MTDILVDSNVLLRSLATNDPRHALVTTALVEALRAGNNLVLAPQIIAEAWVVLTRPLDVNGFGWAPDVAHAALSEVMLRLPLLPETPAVFDAWWQLIGTGVRGKRAHDVRIAAIMLVHKVRLIMTFNVSDFGGLEQIVPFVPGTEIPAVP